MKICLKHWGMLRSAIEDRDLTRLVAQDGREAMARLMETKEAPFDPLMSCNWMIVNRALDTIGLYLLSQNEDHCPICGVMDVCGDKPDNSGKIWTSEEIEFAWINGPADAALVYCQEHKLI